MMMEVADLWFSLTDDEKIIVDIGRDGREFRVKLVQREDLSKPTGEILWEDIQRRGFWESASAFSRTLKAVGKHCPEVSQKRFEDTTKEIMNVTDFEFSEPAKPEVDEISDKSITDTIMARHSFYCDERDPNKVLYIWDSGKWSNGAAEGIILHDLSKIFAEEENRARMMLEKTVNFIKGCAMDTPIKEKPPNLISFKNGMLDLDTMELVPHDMGLFCVNQIPYDYDPNARCPKWTKWLSEVVRMEDIPFIQEWIGYNFFTAYPEVSFLILTGSGQNGKTIFMSTITRMFGDENVTSITLADLTYDNFTVAELHHKLANLSDDIGSTVIRRAGKLKEVSSGSCITAQRKFGQPFMFRPYAKVTYACNEPPEIKDASDAIKYRMKVVEFPFTFVKEPEEGQLQARDRKEIEAELAVEMQGIINWAIEGLKRFLSKNGYFSASRSTEETWKFYQRKSKPVYSFMEECLNVTDDENDKMTIEDMYSALKTWLSTNGIKLRVSRNKMIRDLRDEGIETRQKREDERKRMYYGVTLSRELFTLMQIKKDSNNINVEKIEVSGKNSCDGVPEQPTESRGGGG